MHNLYPQYNRDSGTDPGNNKWYGSIRNRIRSETRLIMIIRVDKLPCSVCVDEFLHDNDVGVVVAKVHGRHRDSQTLALNIKKLFYPCFKTYFNRQCVKLTIIIIFNLKYTVKYIFLEGKASKILL